MLEDEVKMKERGALRAQVSDLPRPRVHQKYDRKGEKMGRMV